MCMSCVKALKLCGDCQHVDIAQVPQPGSCSVVFVTCPLHGDELGYVDGTDSCPDYVGGKEFKECEYDGADY